MKVLDSTFLIDLTRGKQETLLLSKEKNLLTTQICMFEVIRGLFLRNVSSSTVLRVMGLFNNICVLPLDDQAVVKSAEISSELIKAGNVIPDGDCLIAGIALSRGINKIVTKNVKHFGKIKEIKVETY